MNILLFASDEKYFNYLVNIHKELIAIDKLGEEFYEKGFSFSRFKFLIQKLILDIFGRKFLTSIIQVKRKLQGR